MQIVAKFEKLTLQNQQSSTSRNRENLDTNNLSADGALTLALFTQVRTDQIVSGSTFSGILLSYKNDPFRWYISTVLHTQEHFRTIISVRKRFGLPAPHTTGTLLNTISQ